MSTRSSVKLLMSNKAFNEMKEELLQSDNKYVQEMYTNADVLDVCEDYTIIGWLHTKWYSNFVDVSAVLSFLQKLDEIVENNPDKLDDYYYKLLEIREDNLTYEETNDYDDEFTGDFYVTCEFSM